MEPMMSSVSKATISLFPSTYLLFAYNPEYWLIVSWKYDKYKALFVIMAKYIVQFVNLIDLVVLICVCFYCEQGHDIVASRVGIIDVWLRKNRKLINGDFL